MMKILRMGSLLLLLSTQAWAQDRTVTGKVTAAEDGTPLPGVSVVIKGSTTGTTTSADGTYKILSNNTETLVYSFIGTINQEITVGVRTVIDVNLVADVRQLNEVVVTAFGQESRKRSLGVSVTEVKASQIENVRQTNVVNSLTGKVAGVRVQSSNGMVGAGAGVFIRGFTTFTGSNQPLFVVDGIPIDNGGGGNALQSGVTNSNRAIDLNPDDIESMSVLKGPAAAVLYGSRAVAGAIIITTKKGKAGTKNTVSFTTNYNVVEANRLPDYQNQYGQGSNGFYNPNALDSWGPRITGQTVNNYLGRPEILTAYPNNVRDIFRQGSNLQNSISLQGSTDKTTYVFSYSNLQETGILAQNSLTRNTFRITANTKLTDKLSTGVSITYFNTVSQRSPIGNQQSNPLFRGYFLPRTYNLANYPTTNPNGTQSYFDATTDNPLWALDNVLYNDRLDRILGNFNVNYQLTDWLTFDYKLGTDFYTLNIKAIDGVGTLGNGLTASNRLGGVFDGGFTSAQINSYANLRVVKKIGENFGINFLLGNEINAIYSRNQGVTGTNAAIPGFGQITSTLTYEPFGVESTSRLIGAYGQAELNFREWAYVTFTGRNDWSSTFRPGSRSYFYPSVAASLVLTDAIPGLKNNRVLSYLKLRGNYARVGRQAPIFSTDTYLNQANPANGYGPQLVFPFRGLPGYSISNVLGNPILRPEFTTTREGGLEARLFGDRITLDLGYFSTRTTDIIVAVPISVASGYANIVRNSGELESNGVEVGLGLIPVRTKGGFTWEIDANWSRIRTRVIAIDPQVQSIFLGGFTTPQTQLRAGEEYGVIVGNPFNRTADGQLLITATGGGAGQVTNNAATVATLGNPNPRWLAGITNTFSYKGFSASFLLDIRYGGDIISRNIRDVRFRGVAAETGDRERTYVIPGVLRDPNNNPDGSAKALVGSDGQTVPNNIQISAQQYWTSLYNTQGEAIVFDASWIRLREASITYSIPKNLLRSLPVGQMSVSFSGRNLLLYAPNYPHFDPEVNSQGVSNSQGFEFNTLPQARTYGVVLRATF